LSRIEPRSATDLPRFNMPFELGIDVGCKTFSSRKDKRYLVLEVSGQDIKAHEAKPIYMVKSIRDWIKGLKTNQKIDNYQIIWTAHNEFHYDYETELRKDDMNPHNIWEIPFSELTEIMKAWIKNYK